MDGRGARLPPTVVEPRNEKCRVATAIKRPRVAGTQPIVDARGTVASGAKRSAKNEIRRKRGAKRTTKRSRRGGSAARKTKRASDAK